MPNPIQANRLVTGDALPNAVQPANVAIAELIESVRRLEPAIRGTGEAADAATKELASSSVSLSGFAAGLSRSAVVMGLATSQFSSFTSAVQSGIASAVAAFDPAAVKRWELTVRDLHAVFGDIFRPVLERANVVVRALADGVESLSPSAKTMVAALAVAAVSMTTMTVLTAAFSAAVASATGGLSLVAGAVAGLVAGAGTMALTATEFKDTVRELSAAGSAAADELGRAFAQMLRELKPNIDAVLKLTVELAKLTGSFAKALSAVNELGQGLVTLQDVMLGTATGVRLLAENLRFLGGIAAFFSSDPKKIGGSDGKAVNAVRFGSPEDAWREAVKASFSLGNTKEDPARQTNSHLHNANLLLTEIRNLLKSPLTVKALSGGGAGVMGPVNRVTSGVAGGGVLGALDIVDRMRQMHD